MWHGACCPAHYDWMRCQSLWFFLYFVEWINDVDDGDDYYDDDEVDFNFLKGFVWLSLEDPTTYGLCQFSGIIFEWTCLCPFWRGWKQWMYWMRCPSLQVNVLLSCNNYVQYEWEKHLWKPDIFLRFCLFPSSGEWRLWGVVASYHYGA